MSSEAFKILTLSSLLKRCFSNVVTVTRTEPLAAGVANSAVTPLNAFLTLYSKEFHIGSRLSKPGARGVVTLL